MPPTNFNMYKSPAAFGITRKKQNNTKNNNSPHHNSIVSKIMRQNELKREQRRQYIAKKFGPIPPPRPNGWVMPNYDPPVRKTRKARRGKKN